MPSTFKMQELLRKFFNYLIYVLEDGQSPSAAVVLPVPRGTAIPCPLPLIPQVFFPILFSTIIAYILERNKYT